MHLTLSIDDTIQQALRGEAAAQRKLFEAFAPQAFRVAMRYCERRADAEDVVQNTFIRVFNQLSTYQADKGNFGAWVHRISVNESLRVLRKRKPILFVETDTNGQEEIDPMPLVTDHLAAADLRKLILQLPEGYRAVFNLHAVEGYSHQEIAEQLDITAATSRSQLTRAKRTLKQWITAQQSNLRKTQSR